MALRLKEAVHLYQRFITELLEYALDQLVVFIAEIREVDQYRCNGEENVKELAGRETAHEVLANHKELKQKHVEPLALIIGGWTEVMAVLQNKSHHCCLIDYVIVFFLFLTEVSCHLTLKVTAGILVHP